MGKTEAVKGVNESLYKYLVKNSYGGIEYVTYQTNEIKIGTVINYEQTVYDRKTKKSIKCDVDAIVLESPKKTKYNYYEIKDIFSEEKKFEMKIDELYLWEEKPLIIDDDYPFSYENDKNMILLINSARQKSLESINKLVKIYGDENNKYFNQAKKEYWEKEASKI